MKTPSPKIKVISRNQNKFREKMVHKLLAYNESKAGDVGWKSLSLEMSDSKGRFMGGLTGNRFLGWFYVDLLFVEEKVRGKGIGKRLLRAAESWARKNGCRNINLNTITFQAPGFYRKMGYRVFGKLTYPKGNVRYYFKKKL
jgi:GNAT superfamily N-acetyltransferase